MSLSTRGRLLLAAERAVARSTDSTRHKAFVSYHGDDAGEVEQFLDDFGHTFIPRVIGVSDKDDFIDSNDTDYVMDRIRENYLTDSTVTIVLVGRYLGSPVRRLGDLLHVAQRQEQPAVGAHGGHLALAWKRHYRCPAPAAGQPPRRQRRRIRPVVEVPNYRQSAADMY